MSYRSRELKLFGRQDLIKQFIVSAVYFSRHKIESFSWNVIKNRALIILTQYYAARRYLPDIIITDYGTIEKNHLLYLLVSQIN